MARTPQQRSDYRPDIDGLRAIAVLAVLAFHAFPGRAPLGYYGVDVFFTISGYLITGLLLREAGTGRIRLGRFYARRIRRLVPALLVVLAACLAAGFVLMRTAEYERLCRHVLASLGFVQNFNLTAESGYFDTEARAKPLLHLWSLAVEEQFYIVWPTLMLVLASSRRKPGLVLLVVTAASFILGATGKITEAAAFFSPLTRAWELGLGAGLACWLPTEKAPLPASSGVVRNSVSVAALALMLLSFVWAPLQLPQPGVPTLLPVTATLALIAVGPCALVNRRLLGRRELVGVGLISYPLYLWHWPLLSYPFLVLGEPAPAPWRAGALIMSFVLAWATYRWVEQPLRFSLPVRAAVIGLVAGAGAVALAALALPPLHRLIRGRHEAEIEAALSGPFWRFTSNDICEARYGRDYRHFCIQNRPGEPTLMLIGNSYANHFYAGLIAHPATRTETILSLGSCEPSGIYPNATGDCPRQDAVVARSPHLKLLIVGSAWPRFDGEGRMVDNVTGRRDAYEGYPNLIQYETALTRRLRALAAHAPIAIMLPKPELGYDISECYARPFLSPRRDCRMTRRDADAQTKGIRTMLERVAAAVPGATLFDPMHLFCDNRECRFRTEDNQPLLRDLGHYSELGSRLAIGAWLDSRRPGPRSPARR